MCSINDCRFEHDDESTKGKTRDLSDTTLCRKCRCESVDVLLAGQSGYCNACFLTATSHKFRAALGKSKIIRRGDAILVDHSGELNSTVLLHLIKAGLSESTHKKIIFKTVVLYIDDNVARTSEERDALRRRIAEETRASGFDGYAVSLSQVLNAEDALDVKPMGEEMSHERDDQLRAMLAGLSDDTARTDLIGQLRRRLLLSAARRLDCGKIFVADSAVDIAAKALGDVCLGRGAQLSALAGFCDARCTDVLILKPMRDFTQQELAHYSRYHGISCVKPAELGAPAACIQALARGFTTQLESQFSGTVSTVFRTADKVSPRGDAQRGVEDNCALCDASLDSGTSADEVTATRALEVSKRVSSRCVAASSPGNEEASGDSNCLVPGTACSCKNDVRGQVAAEDVWRCLCYSCRRIFPSTEILCDLPAPLLSAIRQRIALKSMKERISDFLL
ncbi:PREDICTED: cytoplasmic tRNA 2-thiolation protein 2 [Vollenhovia emeryi]|uniref:cytoplasmic tRNA 2-thiolation protein 2 n=1 Tax=Vollenhovia emeryi TaxID=411798 RepID=UPI0005F4AF78|nr:PREDICTED: cytoplasmic tRNA 2-thiolation protein 2 [Vollenhovia emeryi]